MNTEKQLVNRAKTDRNAFMEIYEIYYPKLFAFLVVRTRSKELAEDIAQETFVKAIPALKNFEYKDKSFGAWLFRIAQNEMISGWRKSRREVVVSPEEIAEVAEKGASVEQEFILNETSQEENQLLRKLNTALEQLPPEEKNVIIMKYISGLSYQEISCFVKKRPTTLAVELHRALQKLRVILEK